MFTAMTHLNHKLALGLSLLLTSSVATAQQTSANQEIDMTRIEYADRYIGIEELKDTKYHLWPIVEDEPNVVNCFRAINESYYIDLWYLAEAFVSNPDEIVADVDKPQELVVDLEHNYLCVDFNGDGKLMVECRCWLDADSTMLIALNYNYDHPVEDDCFTKTRSSDVLVYRLSGNSGEMVPVVPATVGIRRSKGYRLPRM